MENIEGTHKLKCYMDYSTMEDIVEKCEKLCDAFENIDEAVLDKMQQSTCKVSKAGTLANIRLYYYITKNHTVCDLNMTMAFEQFNFLLTDENSTWNDLTVNDKIALLQKNFQIRHHVIVMCAKDTE